MISVETASRERKWPPGTKVRASINLIPHNKGKGEPGDIQNRPGGFIFPTFRTISRTHGEFQMYHLVGVVG